MAVRGDITVNFDVNPRVVMVAAPSTNVDIQDLVDTLRFIESEQTNMAYPALIKAAGKDDLGGTGFTAITATLQNALLAFEDRPGPQTVLTTCTGGNLVALDAQGLAMYPVLPTAFTSCSIAQSTSPTLVYIQSGTGPLTSTDKDEIADRVWMRPTSAYTDPTTMGGWLTQKILTVAKYIGLS